MKTFLFDMDGTVYLGDELIDGAKGLFEKFKQEKRPYYFLTNNSSKSRDDYVIKLNKLGIYATKDMIYTSSDATKFYLKKNYPEIKNIFIMGTESMMDVFSEYNLYTEKSEHVELVLLGFDTSINYQKFWDACDLLRAGLPYVATHPDYNCPLQGGKFMPDIGAMISFIEASTGMLPEIIGKPYETVIEGFCEENSVDRDELVMVGDRLYTDILTGKNANIKTVLVLSGETDINMYMESDIRADFVYDSILELGRDLDNFEKICDGF